MSLSADDDDVGAFGFIHSLRAIAFAFFTIRAVVASCRRKCRVPGKRRAVTLISTQRFRVHHPRLFVFRAASVRARTCTL